MSEEIARASAEDPWDAERLPPLVERQLDLKVAYQEGIAASPLSRCPLTGAVASYGLDLFDLDGLCWNWGAPLRGEHRVPPSHFCYTGSLRITGPLARAPFVCRPGPEVPYVLPRILGHAGMVAVVSAVAVGPHRGHLVAYFAEPVPLDLPRANEWGACSYFARTTDGFAEHTVAEDVDEYDWDLGAWIERGRLRWVAPGDDSLELRSTLDGCPYLDLEGRRDIPVILDGQVAWSG